MPLITTAITTMALSAISKATPRSEYRIRFIKSLVSSFSVTVPQCDFQAQGIAQRNRPGTGQIDQRLTLRARDDANPRDQGFICGHNSCRVVVRELQAAHRA